MITNIENSFKPQNCRLSNTCDEDYANSTILKLKCIIVEDIIIIIIIAAHKRPTAGLGPPIIGQRTVDPPRLSKAAWQV